MASALSMVVPIVKRVVMRIVKGPVLDEAAELAFYALLALVPFLVVLTSLASFIPDPETIQRLMRRAHFFMPSDAFDLVEKVVTDMLAQKSAAILTIGIVTAIWSASRAANAMRNCLNASFGVEDKRGWLRQQGVAVSVTMLGALLLLLSVVAALVSTNVIEHVASAFGLVIGKKTYAWALLRWPLAFFSIVAVASLIYGGLPDVRPRGKAVFVGAMVATTLFIIISRLFTFYVAKVANYGATYGSLTGLVVLMLWAWLTAIAFIIGGEFVAAIPGVREKKRDYFFDKRLSGW